MSRAITVAALRNARPATGTRLRVGENYVLALLACLLITMSFVFTSRECRHWFVLPLTFCGVLIVADIVAWVRGQLDSFDPKALVALFMFQTAYIGPMLHVSMELHNEGWNVQVRDWQTWFGYMSVLWLGGVAAMKIAQNYSFRRSQPVKRQWLLHAGRLVPSLGLAIGVSAIASAVVLVFFGGLQKHDDVDFVAGSSAKNISVLLMLADPLPLLCFAGLVYMFKHPSRRRSVYFAFGLLVALLIAEVPLLGLRGSRSAMAVLLLMGTMMCHYLIARIDVKWVLLGGVVLFGAAYVYKFYKVLGTEGFRALESAEKRHELERRSGNTMIGTLLGDIGRSDMQTFLLYRVTEHGDRYDYRFGQTYLMAAGMFIPRAIWPGKPPGKTKAGTEAQYGRGTFDEKRRKSARVYGLWGEAMLNFGPLGVLLISIPYGLLLGFYRRKLLSLPADDARLFFVPIITYLMTWWIISDTDNLMFALLKNGTLLGATVWYASVPRRLEPVVSV